MGIKRTKWKIVKYKGDMAFYARCKCGYEYCCSTFNTSQMKSKISLLHNYCPNCGMRMIKEYLLSKNYTIKQSVNPIYISRKRYIVVRDDMDVLCGLARNYQFKPISGIGNTAVKTYLSEKKAWAGFKSSWKINSEEDMKRYKVVEVSEIISSSDINTK